MAISRGKVAAATAVCAMIKVMAPTTKKVPRRIILVRSPTTVSILYAMRLVRPEAVKAVPMTTDPKMNHTEGSKKSRSASLAGRIMNSTWNRPMAMAVMPMGMTSKIHHTPAIKNSPMDILPAQVSVKTFPAGSLASGKPGII